MTKRELIAFCLARDFHVSYSGTERKAYIRTNYPQVCNVKRMIVQEVGIEPDFIVEEVPNEL